MALIECKSEVFAGLTDPYTGLKLRVMMLPMKDGRVLFSSPSAYSTRQTYPTAKEAYNAWARESGIGGVRTGGRIRCAYTGEDLVLKHNDLGWYYEGGFDPNRFVPRAEFLYFASMRNGESKFPKPTPETHAESLSANHNVTGHETQVTQEAVDRAGEAMKAANFKPTGKTTVSMSVPKKGRGAR